MDRWTSEEVEELHWFLKREDPLVHHDGPRIVQWQTNQICEVLPKTHPVFFFQESQHGPLWFGTIVFPSISLVAHTACAGDTSPPIVDQCQAGKFHRWTAIKERVAETHCIRIHSWQNNPLLSRLWGCQSNSLFSYESCVLCQVLWLINVNVQSDQGLLVDPNIRTRKKIICCACSSIEHYPLASTGWSQHCRDWWNQALALAINSLMMVSKV